MDLTMSLDDNAKYGDDRIRSHVRLVREISGKLAGMTYKEAYAVLVMLERSIETLAVVIPSDPAATDKQAAD